MADTDRPWVARFQAWIAEFLLQVQNVLLKDSLSAIIVEKLTGYGTREQVDAYYDALPAHIKNNLDVKAAWEKARDDKQSLDDEILAGITERIGGTAEQIAATYMKIEGATPDTALDAAIKLVIADTAKDISVGLYTASVEALSLGQVETVPQYFKFLKAKTGYGGPITMLMKHPIELGIISPLSKALHAQYRDAWIKSDAALRLFTKDLIDETTMKKSFQYEGYPEAQMNALIEDRWRELRLGELAWAFNDATADDAWLEKRLQYALYAPDDRKTIAKMLKDKFLNPYRNRVAAQLRNQYKEGYITAQEFRLKLKELDIPLMVRDLMIQEADALFHYDHNADLISIWTTAYKNDIISENVLRGNLKTIIADPARLEAAVLKAKYARRPEKIAEPEEVKQGVRVGSKPSWSSIILDGEDTGRLTPDSVTTLAGRHTVTISAPGYRDESFDVDVPPGQFVEIYAPLEKILPAA